MKSHSVFLIAIATALALVLVGCPSPTGSSPGGDSSIVVTEARVVESAGGLVFIEEDGTETPILSETDGPVELIDYAVLDDGVDARSAASGNSPRCIIVGRRQDGGSGVWAYYRGLGVLVIPYEDGVGDSSLLEQIDELVEPAGSDWFTEGWTCEATAISDDGKVVLGNVSRPDGWEYLEGEDVPDPEIGIWWNIYETEDYLVLSHPRPIIMMEEPEETVASGRCVEPDPWQWLEELKKLAEKLFALVLDQAWNYMATADGFVDPEILDALDIVVADGLYPVAGVDKHGAEAWAWITAFGVEKIEDAREAEDPQENLPPYPVTGPTLWNYVTIGEEVDGVRYSTTFDLEGTDDENRFDPNGDTVIFNVVDLVWEPYDSGSSFVPEIAIDENGTCSLVWDPIFETTQYQIRFSVETSDGTLTTSSDAMIQIQTYFIPVQE